MAEQDRRRSMAQALASTRIEGHVPSPEFLADCERFARGEISQADVRAASLARAQAAERRMMTPAEVRDDAEVADPYVYLAPMY